jgi:hypothetical protein
MRVIFGNLWINIATFVKLENTRTLLGITHVLHVQNLPARTWLSLPALATWGMENPTVEHAWPVLLENTKTRPVMWRAQTVQQENTITPLRLLR